MAVLTDNIEISEKPGMKITFPVVASDIIYRGALCKINAGGYLAPCVAEAGSFFAGVAYEKCDNSAGAAGDKECQIMTEGMFLLTAAGMAITDVGSPVYATDDNLVSTVDAGNEQLVGKIMSVVSATQIWVKLA